MSAEETAINVADGSKNVSENKTRDRLENCLKTVAEITSRLLSND